MKTHRNAPAGHPEPRHALGRRAGCRRPRGSSRAASSRSQLGSQLKSNSRAPLPPADRWPPSTCATRGHRRSRRSCRRRPARRSGGPRLRVRNPANAPDGIERDVLEQFSADLGLGQRARPARGRVRDRPQRPGRAPLHARHPTDALCLTCHGKSLAPEVAAAIARDYPGDQATGFEQGQLRGAFVRHLARRSRWLPPPTAAPHTPVPPSP